MGGQGLKVGPVWWRLSPFSVSGFFFCGMVEVIVVHSTFADKLSQRRPVSCCRLQGFEVSFGPLGYKVLKVAGNIGLAFRREILTYGCQRWQ